MKNAILHNFYLMESNGAGRYVVYSGPSAKTQITRWFKSADLVKNELDAKAFLYSLGR